MESAYETVPGYWRKANTAIRECFFSRYRAEGDICPVCQERRAFTSCTVEDRPTATRSDCLTVMTVIRPSACDLQTCDFRPLTSDFRLLPLPHSLALSLPAVSPSTPARGLSLSNGLSNPSNGATAGHFHFHPHPHFHFHFHLHAGTVCPCLPSIARRAKEVPARHSPQGDGGFIFA